MSIASVYVSWEHDINDFKCLLGVVLILLEQGLLNSLRFPGTVVIVPSGNLRPDWCHCLFTFAASPGMIFLLGLNDVGIPLI